MTIRKILTEPDPFLRQKSEIVEEVNDETRSLMDDMLETMYDTRYWFSSNSNWCTKKSYSN